MRKEQRKIVRKIGKNLVILDAQTLFMELMVHSTRYVAKKHKVGCRALTYRLRELDESKYEEIVSKRKTRGSRTRTSVPEDTWTKLENGRSLRSIALENRAVPSVFHQQARTDTRYKLAIEKRKEHYHRQILEAAMLFKEGSTLASLSEDFHIAQAKLADEICQVIGEEAYLEILHERRRNPSNKIPLSVIKSAAERFEQGARITSLSDEYGIDRHTLRRRLHKLLGIKYHRITEKRRVSTESIYRIARKFKRGASLIGLSNEFRVPLTTLRRKLSMILGQEYKDIVKKRLRLSLRSKGEDSLFERHVEAVPTQNRIPFKRRVILEIKGHRYRPDFMVYAVSPPLIIEAAGMNREDYWTKIKRKTEDCVQAGYQMLCVLPDKKQILKKALKHLSSDLLIDLNDFDELTRPGRMALSREGDYEVSEKMRTSMEADIGRVTVEDLLLRLKKGGKVGS